MKRVKSVFRDVGVGRVEANWQERVDICSRCPLCVVDRKHAFCGKPFLSKIDRDEATEGCGCPIVEKAKDPTEHCPRDRVYNPASKDATCQCMWCTASAARSDRAADPTN